MSKIHIFFVTFNEADMLGQMMAKYRAQFADCRFTVFDNQSTDTTADVCTQHAATHILFDTGGKFDDERHIEIKNNCWKGTDADWVIVSDTDEFCCISDTDLEHEQSLGTTIIKFRGYDMVCPSPLERSGEADLRNITHGVENWAYSKKYMFRPNTNNYNSGIDQIAYFPGCHNAMPTGIVKTSKKEYPCFHYRYIYGVDYLLERYEVCRQRLSENNLKNDYGIQYHDSAEVVTERYNKRITDSKPVDLNPRTIVPNLLTDHYIFTINLPHRTDRAEHINTEMQRIGVEHHLTRAVNGLETAYQGPISKGAYGCKLSHLKIIRHAKGRAFPYVTIIEDDCVFVEEVETRLIASLPHIPSDWDILYYGANHRVPPLPVNDHIGRCRHALSTLAYVVRDTVYDLILQKAAELDKEIDLIYAETVHPLCNAYCLVPNLAAQRPGFSDVEGREMDYGHLY